MIYAQIGALFVITICLFALLKGDEAERFGASAYVLTWFATVLIQPNGQTFSTQSIMMGLDVIYLLILAAIAWKYKNTWPVWAAALQLVSVMSHIFKMATSSTPSAALYTVLNLTGYGVLLCIAVGTFWAWQERRAAGIE